MISKYPTADIRMADGSAISDINNFAATGMTASVGGNIYTIAKLGDANGDGNITPADYVKVKNNIMGTNNLTQYTLIAADANGDGSITPADYVKIKNHIMSVSSIII